MPSPYRYQSPDTRLRHIKFARDREEERKGRLDEMDARRQMQIDQEMQRETQRSADLDQRDSIGQQMQVETQRKADLDRREAAQPRGLGMRGRYQEGMPLGPAVPGAEMRQREALGGQPTLGGTPEQQLEEVYLRELGGRMRRGMDFETASAQAEQAATRVVLGQPEEPEQGYDLLQPMTAARAKQAGGGLGGLVERGLGEVGEFIRGEPMLGGPFAEPAGGGPTMATRGLEAIERFRTRVTVPAGASLMQILETRAGATTGGGVAGTPLRTGPISEIAEPGVVVAPKAWFGDEEEQARAQQVMEEAGLIKALVFEFIADPTLLLPGPLGFTKVDDVVRFVKAGAKLTGKARQAWLGSPKVQRLVRAVRAEAGGPRVPGVGPEDVARVTPEGPLAARESAMTPPQVDEAVARLDAPEVAQATQSGDVHNAFQRMVTDSLEGGGLPPRKPPYTAARTGPPDNPGGALNAASGAPPGRVATDLWRQWEGRMNEAIDRVVRLEGGDAYTAARSQKLKISKTRTPEMEDAMEKFWLRGPVESFDEKWRPVVRDLYRMLDEEEALMLAADPSFSNKLLDKYFPHLFKARGRGGMPPPGKLGQKPGFLRERKLEGPLGEILEANPELDLFTWDPIDFVLRRRLAGEQYRANLEVLQRMRAQGLALKRGAAPADWVIPNAPAFQPRAIPGRPDMFTSPIAVPKDVAKVLNDWYGTSFMTTNAAFNVLRRGAITAKFTKVFGGLFQYFDYTMRTLGISTGYQDIRGLAGVPRAWARAWVPGIDKKLLRFDIQNPVRNRLIKDGLNVRGPTDIVEATFRQNYGEDILPIPLLKQVTEFLTSRSYSGLHREMVLTNAETLFRHYRGQGLDEAAASVKAVRKTHEFFSTLPAWQSIWRSPGMRDVMRTFGLFSMGETEGWFRNFFRLFQPTQAKDAARFWFGMMAVTAGLANGISMAVTGKPLGKDQWLPFTYDKDERRGIPYIGYNTNFMRPELPYKGPFGRTEHLDLLGQADTPFRWALDPIFGLETRLAQYPQWGINALLLSKGEKPLFGERPQGVKEIAEFAVGQVAPIPGMGFLQERERIGTWGGGIQASGFNVSAEPLRNVIARQFEEKHGRPFNPETDFRIVEQDEDFKPILAELNRLGLKFESEGALRASAIERTRLDLEQRTGLVTTAQGIADGKAGAEAEFASAFDDYNTQMVGAYAVSYLDVEDKRETPEGKALRAYLALDMESFRDPETLEVDRDAFYAERDRLFAELPADLQKAIEADLKSENEMVLRYEPEYQEAKRVRNEIYDQPKYPIDPEKEKVLFEFLDFVRQEYERGKRQYGDDFPSLPELARLIGRKNNERRLGENAADVLSNKAPLNKGRLDLALKYQDILSRYFPDVLRRVLPVELERELGEEAFERMTAR